MICIDPGVKACGVAAFCGRGVLRHAVYVPVEHLEDYLDDLLYGQNLVLRYGQNLIIEMPRIYPGSGQQKGDLNDLLDLASVVGLCESFYNPTQRERVFPAQWKGQVPKKIMTARILSKLTPAERVCIQSVGAKDHNIIDAIGIGLWKLSRL